MSLETGDNDLAAVVTDKLHRARRAARACATLSPSEKNAALEAMAVQLWEQRTEIVAANDIDVAQARVQGQTETRIDRLILTEKRIQEMVEGLRQVQDLRDPMGDILEVIERPNGLVIHKIRVPMGVLAMIYESRPNVTVDAAGLAVKTGNAVVLRGGREALHSNVALVQALRQGLANAGVASDAIQLIDRTERESVDLLIRAKGLVDLAIPRGGAGLIERVTQRALVPVIETGVGNCHVYVDGEADPQMASRIVQNAKVQRPSVCNAMESLLVHQAIAATWVPSIAATLNTFGVELRVCERANAILEAAGVAGLRVATEEDFATEFLGLVLAVKVVDSAAEAMEHIATYGTKHTEAIVTENVQTAEAFLSTVDAAVVVHNASTRFTDGFEFGFGAEIGISTQKLHARGPMGLRELTSYKYVIRGVGQVRG
ncbi:MAG: glutamate-5-semialdehyde dehydrogenase [Alicyclobacillus sp. RIFOXYA1_FULL_53_8]|nr:MAG: glutamate-5-semialdehyde dehydrogenase [Alicyclobacillus sp. RIFOXYA1_FULL_53_8]